MRKPAMLALPSRVFLEQPRVVFIARKALSRAVNGDVRKHTACATAAGDHVAHLAVLACSSAELYGCWRPH